MGALDFSHQDNFWIREKLFQSDDDICFAHPISIEVFSANTSFRQFTSENLCIAGYLFHLLYMIGLDWRQIAYIDFYSSQSSIMREFT